MTSDPKDFHFGGAVDYFPGPLTIATIDNLTRGNLIVFLDGEPFGIAISSGEPFVVSVDGFGPHVLEDHTFEIKDNRFQTLYKHYQHKEDAGIAVVIVPYETAPAPGYTNYYYDGVKIHNPNGERSVIFVNGNPFGVAIGHSGTFVKFINPALDYASYSYLVEARNTHDELLYSPTFDYAQIVNRETLLLPIEPYSLSMNNLTDQQLILSINGEFVGDINSQSHVFFTDLKISPSINWNSIEYEYYLFEAKDSNGNVLYSENLEWTVIDSKKGVISIPFSKGPKLIISNTMAGDLTIFLNNKQVGILVSRTVGYYTEPGYVMDAAVTIKNATGKTVYSNKAYSLGPDINIRIPSANK